MKNAMTAVSLYVNRLTNRLMKLALAIGIVLCVIMTLSALGQVFCRFTNLFVFQSSEEIARFCMCWMAMLGSAAALRQGRHLGVRVIVERLPAGFYDKYLAPLIQLVMLVFFIMLTVKGWSFAMRGSAQLSPSLEIPMMYPYLCLPIGGALMALNVFSDMLQDRFPTPEGSCANIAAAVMENLIEVEAEVSRGTEVFDPLHSPNKEDL